MGKRYYIYIMANQQNGTLYVGVTSNLGARIFEHKNHILPGFTDKYDVDRLVYIEYFDDICEAIKQEKRLKKWNRNWKKDLIEKYNPDWRDLYNDIHQFI